MEINKSGIAFRLSLFAAFFIIALLAIGIESWYTLKTTFELQTDTLTREAALSHSIDLARDAQVNFKIQVQDFKDILLRGQDPVMYDKYLNDFTYQHEAVVSNLQQLEHQFTLIGLDTVHVQEIQDNQLELYNIYLNALKQFNPKQPDNIFSIDKQLRGIDRIPTQKMDNIVAYVQTQSERLRKEANRQTKENFQLTTQWLIVVILVALVIGIISTLKIVSTIRRQLALALDFTQSLTRGTSKKMQVVQAISDGNLDQELVTVPLPDIDEKRLSKDEIGDMVRDVLEMSNLQAKLDSSIIKMSAALRQSRNTEQARDWLKSGQNDLNQVMQGDHDSNLLADGVLTYLVHRLGAAAALFYLYNPKLDQLQMTASYGTARDRTPVDNIKMGDRLIGKAIQENKIILLSDVPPTYLPVASGWGESTPCCVLIIPLVNDRKCIGAIELGSFTIFTELEQEFLNIVKENIAIGLDVNLSRRQTALLLEETRQQTEELRVQQEELQQSNEELEERAEMLEQQREQIRQKSAEVERSNIENLKKNAELEVVNKYKSEFMANMSHELRTPLNSMLILSGLMKENKDKNLTAKQVEYAATINNAGKDLLNLINDILDLSKVESGLMEFQYTDAHPGDLCTSMSMLFSATMDQKKLTFSTNIAADVPANIFIDQHRVQQILKNLISNAIKFTETGGVSLQIYVSDRSKSPLPVSSLAFAIADTGIGVPEEKQHLIFDAFKQADGGISRKYGGTGLGLSISRELARKMGGELLMTSVEGHGSTFTLYLPSANENSREKPVGTIQTTPKATKLPPTVTNEFQGCGDLPMAIPDDRAQITPEDRTLLIIEDDLSFAKIIMEFVREHGFLPIVAGDGESGIALANYYLPDAILLDAMLPEMDGWEVISNLKKNNLTKHIPVHFMTCLEDDKRAFNLGAIGFITKPVSQDQMNDVFRTIENTLDNLDRRLLIVEDDDNQAASLHALLSSPKIQVEIAKDVKTAIEFLNNNHVDCIVLDLGLNDISNLSLLSQIQQLKSHKNTPIIIHSGRDISHEQEKEMKKFAQSIIVKGAKSQERLLDEVTLFLHMVGKNLNSEKQPDTSESMQSETSLTGKKVLLVDDDMRNIFSLTSLLDALEIVVIEAENGLEALTRLNEHTDIKLVLMDIMMPEMDGYEAMRHIRQHRTYNNIPIIAMTAKAMTDDKQKCLDAGASDYISKPIDTQKLISTMRVWIAKEQ